ncbi:MAG: serine/threonine protein kinase [Verrucomicrobiaceae bacterium]|nr:serine/threonine protein kinase [Verrucomicrobiaceae bacterium]
MKNSASDGQEDTSEDSNETILGLNPADLLLRGLQSGKSATGSPQAWQPPTPEELAALLPQYEIEALLGRGGMGAVYRGKQMALDRAVAIKLLPAELAADTEFLTRFQREARTLAKLQHPGIVAVHDFGQTSEGHLFFVMEFVNGTDLARLIHGPGVNPAQALEIIAQVCEALQYAHSQGVIHRDIKPANVLVNQEGRAKLADFGLARPTSDETASLTRSNVVMGTPDYIAPEQMYGHADHRADLYSLGIMLYEMLTGQTPRGAWAPPSQRVQVDVRLDQVVIRALQQDPAMRYQQASEIKTDVDVIRTTPLPKAAKAKVNLASAAPGQRTTPLPKAKRPANKVAWAAAIVLPLLAVAGWWGIIRNDPPHWQRIERTEAAWKADGFEIKDGWVDFGSLNVNKHTTEWKMSEAAHEKPVLRNMAVRVRFKWNDQLQPQSVINLFVRTSDVKHPMATLWRDDVRLVLAPMKRTLGDFTLNPSLKQGQEGIFEVAVIEDRILVRVDGKVAYDVVQAGLSVQGGFEVQSHNCWLRDFEYLKLDGIADPLKALEWDVSANAPSTIPWTRIERTAEEWAKTGQTLKDGWVHNPDKNILVFDRLSAAKATSQFVVRTKVKFHEIEACLLFVNQTAGGHTWRKIQFYSHKQTILNGDHPPATTQRHVTKVEPR